MTLLQEYREEKGLSKVAVAKELGVSDAAVHCWEKGTAVPYEKMLKKIAALIDVDVQTLADDFAANRQTKPNDGAAVSERTDPDSRCLPKVTHTRYQKAVDMAMARLRSITDDSKSVRLAAEFLAVEIENILFVRQN